MTPLDILFLIGVALMLVAIGLERRRLQRLKKRHEAAERLNAKRMREFVRTVPITVVTFPHGHVGVVDGSHPVPVRKDPQHRKKMIDDLAQRLDPKRGDKGEK